MPHGLFGLGWGEVVSVITLVTVILTYAKTSISKTAHESSHKDLEDLNDKLIDFKFNVTELSGLLKQLNRDLSTLTDRVDKHDQSIDEMRIDIAKIKEHLGVDNHDDGN